MGDHVFHLAYQVFNNPNLDFYDGYGDVESLPTGTKVVHILNANADRLASALVQIKHYPLDDLSWDAVAQRMED